MGHECRYGLGKNCPGPPSRVLIMALVSTTLSSWGNHMRLENIWWLQEIHTMALITSCEGNGTQYPRAASQSCCRGIRIQDFGGQPSLLCQHNWKDASSNCSARFLGMLQANAQVHSQTLENILQQYPYSPLDLEQRRRVAEACSFLAFILPGGEGLPGSPRHGREGRS